MTDSMSDAVLRRIQREIAAAVAMDLGRVTAINADTKSVTVELTSGPVSALRWLKPYTPTVGQLVVVRRVRGEWIVDGELSTDFTNAPPVYTTIIVEPVLMFEGSRLRNYGDVWEDWIWFTGDRMSQGGVRGAAAEYQHASYAIVAPQISSLIPSGATITASKLTMARSDFFGSALVSPVIYGHLRTATSSTPTGPPVFASGYGPWRPGNLAKGQAGTWDVPSGWIAALMAGTITGLGLYSTVVTDYATFQSMRLEITYSTPA